MRDMMISHRDSYILCLLESSNPRCTVTCFIELSEEAKVLCLYKLFLLQMLNYYKLAKSSSE